MNLAFDANELRLAMIWQGGFIDAARHWTDRGAGFEGPLGDNVLQLPAGRDVRGPGEAGRRLADRAAKDAGLASSAATR